MKLIRYFHGFAIPVDRRREELPPIKEIRDRCIDQLDRMRPDHMRRLNPTPYKVSYKAIYLHPDRLCLFIIIWAFVIGKNEI